MQADFIIIGSGMAGMSAAYRLSKHGKVIVLENVKHFIHHNKKRTINTVLGSLQELGYNINYKILNIHKSIFCPSRIIN